MNIANLTPAQLRQAADLKEIPASLSLRPPIRSNWNLNITQTVLFYAVIHSIQFTWTVLVLAGCINPLVNAFTPIRKVLGRKTKGQPQHGWTVAPLVNHPRAKLTPFVGAD